MVLARSRAAGSDVIELLRTVPGQTGEGEKSFVSAESQLRAAQHRVCTWLRLIGVQHKVVHRTGVVGSEPELRRICCCSAHSGLFQIGVRLGACLEEMDIIAYGIGRFCASTMPSMVTLTLSPAP